MTCQDVQMELVAFHFATVTTEQRRVVEDHLLSCRECLGTYLSLKREIETAAGGERPSQSSRDRLRGAVAREIARGEPRRAWSWWERPLAFGCAAAAVLAAIATLRAMTPGAGAVPHSLAAHVGGDGMESPRPTSSMQ